MTAAEQAAPDHEAGEPLATTPTHDATPVHLLTDAVPNDLTPDAFYERLIHAALERTPVRMYPRVRERLKQARAGAPGAPVAQPQGGPTADQ